MYSGPAACYQQTASPDHHWRIPFAAVVIHRGRDQMAAHELFGINAHLTDTSRHVLTPAKDPRLLRNSSSVDGVPLFKSEYGSYCTKIMVG